MRCRLHQNSGVAGAQIDEVAGTFAAISLALTGLAMALLVPPLMQLFR